MGKVYLKTKYDNEMKMEIPHNHNFASAMFGFREMAAEIVPYHLIDDIYDDFKREDIALDYIDQCNVLFNKFGVTPHIPDYPDVLKPFLGRKIWKDTINSISRDENKWSAGYFVKPAVRSKAFTGKTISSIKDLMGCGNHAEDYEVLVSESLDIAAEWRCFITYDEIIDVRPYGMIIDKSRKQIKKLLMENGYTVKDVQNAMGFENPQAIYKWISGRSLPSLDNFVILSRLLHTSIEDILVVDGDVVRLWGIIHDYRKSDCGFSMVLNRWYNDKASVMQ